MKTVGILNFKGGVGKTATAVNLAAAAYEAGRRVLLVDLEPQASATEHLTDDAFAKDASVEARRVVWPTRKETTQVTLTVFAFVVVMAIFLWLVDKGLEWVLYDLVLGWKG